MKKALSIAILFVMLVAILGTGVKAVTSETLADDIYSKLSAYGMQKADKIKIERYLSDNKVEDEDAQEILRQVNWAVIAMDEAGVKNVKDIKDNELKQYLLSSAQYAVSIVGLTLTYDYDDNSFTLTDKNGKVIEEGTLTADGTLKFTGSETLADDIYAKLQPYGMQKGDKLKIERYLSDNKVEDEDAQEILWNVNRAVMAMDEAGVKNVKDIKDNELKQYILSCAQSAVSVVGLTLTYDYSNDSFTLADKDGKVIEEGTITADGTLKYTGSNSVVLVVSAIAIFALAAVVVAKTRSAKVGA